MIKSCEVTTHRRGYAGDDAWKMFEIAQDHGFDWVSADSDLRNKLDKFRVTAHVAGMCVICHLEFDDHKSMTDWWLGAKIHSVDCGTSDKAFSEIFALMQAADERIRLADEAREAANEG